MPIFTFRAVRREPNGILGPTLYEQEIEAADGREAIAIARAIEIDLEALGGNAVYLMGPAGLPLWTLHAKPQTG